MVAPYMYNVGLGLVVEDEPTVFIFMHDSYVRKVWSLHDSYLLQLPIDVDTHLTLAPGPLGHMIHYADVVLNKKRRRGVKEKEIVFFPHLYILLTHSWVVRGNSFSEVVMNSFLVTVATTSTIFDVKKASNPVPLEV